jgi:hypothetical protein
LTGLERLDALRIIGEWLADLKFNCITCQSSELSLWIILQCSW